MTKNFIWVLVLVIAAVVLGLWFQQNPPGRAPGRLTPSPDPVDFGAAYVGTTVKRTVTWTNNGAQAVAVHSYGASNDPFSVDQAVAPAMPFNVNPGAVTPALTFTFSPADKGTFTSHGNLLSVGPVSVTRVPLQGLGVYSSTSGALAIQVPVPVGAAAGTTNPEFVDFGRVIVGQTAGKNVDVRNGSAQNLNANATWSPAVFAATFPNNPIAIAAHGTTNVTVTFVPAQVKEYWGVVLFSDPQAPTNYTAVVLHGEGING